MKLGEHLSVLFEILCCSRKLKHHMVHQALHVPEPISAVSASVFVVAYVFCALIELLDEFAEDQIVVHMIESEKEVR